MTSQNKMLEELRAFRIQGGAGIRVHILPEEVKRAVGWQEREVVRLLQAEGKLGARTWHG